MKYNRQIIIKEKIKVVSCHKGNKKFGKQKKMLIFVTSKTNQSSTTMDKLLLTLALTATHYLFVYFTGNAPEKEQVCYAVSDDGFNYSPLNNGLPIIGSDTIARAKGVRDPHILRCDDGWFRMTVTDMRCRQGWDSNRGIVLLRSRDMVHWEHHTVHFPERFAGTPFAHVTRVWAPQTFFDQHTGRYMVYFSLLSSDGTIPYDRVYWCYANSDFTDLEGVPQVLFDFGAPAIDSDIVRDERGLLHLFFKTEADGAHKGIRQYVFKDIYQSSTWKLLDGFCETTKSDVEGAGVFPLINGGWCLMYDCYRDHYYQFTKSRDLRRFHFVQNTKTEGAFTPRHGTVIPITTDEYQRLLTAFPSADSHRRMTPLDVQLDRTSDNPFSYSVPVPDGNYRVTITVGSRQRAAQTVVRAESRRHFFDAVNTKKGHYQTLTFLVNKHSARIDATRQVKLKPREWGYKNWDDSLTLHFCGPAPAVKSIHIEPDTTSTTVFLCGNSTVVDQENEPWASWGQMVTRWFDSSVAIANYAESGLSATTFLAQLRLDKILTQLRAGDYVICEFGHNDEKEHRPGDGAWYSYTRNLKVFADRVRQQGGNIIFVTPTARRLFNADHKTLAFTHGDYPEAMSTVARREQIPLIELNAMTRTFFTALGEEGSKQALVHYAANTFPDQSTPLADNTHFNPYGAWQVSRMVVMGLKQLQSPLADHLRPDFLPIDPSRPDSPSSFIWYMSGSSNILKPDGN